MSIKIVQFLLLVNLISTVFLFTTNNNNQYHPLSDEFINLINEKATTWVAGRNFPYTISTSHLTSLTGTLTNSTTNYTLPEKETSSFKFNLPQNFDARIKWPKCESINNIRNQYQCGSCWAFGAVETISDRICIFSNNSSTKNVYLSAQDVLSCASPNGCNGELIENGWKYWMEKGIVTGGPYGSNQGCRSYEISPSDQHPISTPLCKLECQKSYPISYLADKHFGKQIYKLTQNEMAIRNEIYINGPVEASYNVYHDFLHYKNGIYHHVTGSLLGGHAIRILGWGEENRVPYWLAANSWSTSWGKLGGFFKILRGSNECQIEQNIVAGIPKI